MNVFSLPISELAQRIRNSQLTSIELCEHYISQIPYEERDHALYIAFGPYKDPRYAVSIIIEHGGSGSSAAAPIAKDLFKLIIDRHQLRESKGKEINSEENV